MFTSIVLAGSVLTTPVQVLVLNYGVGVTNWQVSPAPIDLLLAGNVQKMNPDSFWIRKKT